MNYLKKISCWPALAFLPFAISSCTDHGIDNPDVPASTITVENVLESKPLVQSGTFHGAGSPGLVLPDQSVSIHFAAAKGQALSFATMYGWSNDLFFAPENPGIPVYDTNGDPIEGDVSAWIKLWANGTRVNQQPGAAVSHPGTADTKNITEVNGTDAQGNSYLPASKLVNATLINDQAGGMVSQQIPVSAGDRLAIAAMYGFSNDWFFASEGNGVDAMQKGDISNIIKLYDNGTAINQFPGAGITQFNLAGTPLIESKPIAQVPNPNGFTTLPDISKIIRVIIK